MSRITRILAALAATAVCLVLLPATTGAASNTPPAPAHTALDTGPVDPVPPPAPGTYHVSVTAGPDGDVRTVTHPDGTQTVTSSTSGTVDPGVTNPNPYGPNSFYRNYTVVCDGTNGAYPPYVRTSSINWQPDTNFNVFYNLGTTNAGCVNNPTNQRTYVYLVNAADSGKYTWCTRMDATANVNHYWVTAAVVWFNYYRPHCRYSDVVIGHWISYGKGYAFGLRGWNGPQGTTSVMNWTLGTSVKYATDNDQLYLVARYPADEPELVGTVGPACAICRPVRSQYGLAS